MRCSCKGLLVKDSDGYEEYLTCVMCGRSYALDGLMRKKVHLKKASRKKENARGGLL